MEDKRQKNFYDKFDDAIMYGVNKGVQAWNWTTGRTKADLANGIILLSGMTTVLGTYAVDPKSSIGALIATTWVGKDAIKTHNELEKKEERAYLSNSMNLGVANYRDKAKYLAPMLFCMGGALVGLNHSAKMSYSDRVGMDLAALFFSSFGVSAYVMRADYLPPRKSVLGRAKDKLVEMIESAAPQPVAVRAN